MARATRAKSSHQPGPEPEPGLNGAGISSSAAGQLFEFRVWSELIAQSRGGLHVFLPLLDRGLDGVVHRLSDGAYFGIQCKSRATLRDSMLNFVVPVGSVVDDSAWMVAGLNAYDAGIGPVVLAVPVPEFRRLAAIERSAGIEWYEASFSMHPKASLWQRWLVPRERLAAVFMAAGSAPAEAELGTELMPAERETGWLGFLGESEVVRRLAVAPEIDLFRPFPDLETVEVLCRDNRGAASRWCGLQVKTGVVRGEPPLRVHVNVRLASFAAAAATWIVVLAWVPEVGGFHSECLLIPSGDLARIAPLDGPAYEIVWRPASSQRTVWDPYRRSLAEMPALVLERMV